MYFFSCTNTHHPLGEFASKPGNGPDGEPRETRGNLRFVHGSVEDLDLAALLAGCGSDSGESESDSAAGEQERRRTPVVADNVVAVLDPPRCGLKPALCRALRRLIPLKRIVFVSCNPTSEFTRFDYIIKRGGLRDNLELLCGPAQVPPRGEALETPCEEGTPFRVVAARPVDMFPHTLHVELVVVLER